MKYLVLGVNGMAGHIIAQYLLEKGELTEGIARIKSLYCPTYEMDIHDTCKLEKIILEGEYDYVINAVGILNQACDRDIANSVWINAYLPHFLASFVQGTQRTRLIQMSTDCVFSGKKGSYTEVDFPDGESIYDRTKALGEVNDDWNLTFRNSIIGPDVKKNGIGLFNWFMKQTKAVNGFEKSLWTGVTTLTLAQAMHAASKQKLTGLYNLVNNEVTNKYRLLELFNIYMNKGIEVNRVDGISHDKSLVNTRTDFDFVVPTYEKQIEQMCLWIEEHRQMYPHYFCS